MIRPYRVVAYPVVPVLFVLVAFALLLNSFAMRPRESLMGLGLMLLGVPFYFWWKKRNTWAALEKR